MTDSLWHGDDVDLDAYLSRIGHHGDVAPDLATLRALHSAHVDAIAFDNLDPLLGRTEVPLALDRLQDKIVRRGRGGWCLEQVTLMAAVLDRIGFTFTAFAGRTRVRTGSRVAPALHVALNVELDGEHWIHDVSFGAFGPHEPVPLAAGARLDGDWPFDVIEEPGGELVLRFLRAEGPQQLYGFTTDVRYPSDFELLNHFCLTHPRSPFNHAMVLQRTQPKVRHLLAGTTLIELRPGAPATQRELGVDEALAAPAEIFGITLDADESQALRERLAGR